MRRLAGTVAAVGAMALAFATVGGVGDALGGNGRPDGRAGDGGCRIGAPQCVASTTITTTDTVTQTGTMTETTTVTETDTDTVTVAGGVVTTTGETVTLTTGTVTVDGTTTTVDGGTTTVTETATTTQTQVVVTTTTPVVSAVLTCSYTAGAPSGADPFAYWRLCPSSPEVP